MKSAREPATAVLAISLLRRCEADLLGLHTLLRAVHAAMRRLVEDYRKEFPGFPLVLYLKARKWREELLALYWAALAGPPKKALSPSGRRKPRFRRHLAGRLTRCRIFLWSEVRRKTRLLELDRQAMLLNEAHQVLTAALLSAERRFGQRAVRRPWETEDLDLQAPPVSPDLPLRLHTVLGEAWRLFLRIAATEVDLEALSAAYQAQPIEEHLQLVFTRDEAHPHGRARWLDHGKPLARFASSGIQDRLTDEWMRRRPRRRIAKEKRRLLGEVERTRRHLIRQLARYLEPLGQFQRRTAEAHLVAQRKLAEAESRGRGVA